MRRGGERGLEGFVSLSGMSGMSGVGGGREGGRVGDGLFGLVPRFLSWVGTF